MFLLNLSWLEIGLILLVSLTFLLVTLALKKLNQLQKKLLLVRKETYMLVQALRNETHAMGSGSIGVGKRLVEVEKRLNTTMEKQAELEQKDPAGLPYAYAMRLAEMGASADELVKNCGLARSEAELITLVQAELKAQKNNPRKEESYSFS